ncbi:type II toxin-antitoxin system RatA family toxin [Ectothiorhodospiraceae bacterium BW-2]|nr:type II toxin-antitoxin system RatA family toxin [Ectothiorhodospiraceae bacterium BW-2]
MLPFGAMLLLLYAGWGLQRQLVSQQLVEESEIRMRLVKGPFKHLDGHWCFIALPQQGCQILLDIEFEFANRLISMALGPVFNPICHTLVDAFVKRAAQIYTAEDKN